MNTIYKNNLYLICLSFLVIISNNSCVDSGIGLQPKNKDIQKITATEEEKKKMFEEMAEKLKEVGSSAEEFSRYHGGEARDKALEGAKPINKKEQDELYEKLKEAVRESVRMDVGKGKSDELDISLIEEIFILQREKLRGALKADPYFFHLDRDCFVADKETDVMNFYINSTYIDIVKYYMGYDPFKIIDF